jgi:hypothetical protein
MAVSPLRFPRRMIDLDGDASGTIDHRLHPLFDAHLDTELPDQALHELLVQDLRSCHYCGKETGSLKSFELPTVLCLFPLYIPTLSFETEPISACPSCMRWYIAKFLLCNILTANITWPAFSLLPSVYLFAMTFPKGHTRAT